MALAARLSSSTADLPPAPSGSRRPVRPEIQALRALAVSLVVLNHLWPSKMPGGYVGVDVFFVISGYLITSHLLGGMSSSRSFSLAGFYRRRIRRLLPASVTVLLLTGASTWLFVPSFLWREVGRQLVASAFYVQNWALALDAVDYSAPSSDVSPLQHFWSLSVEEQFYLAWPLLLLAAFRLDRRRRAQRCRAASSATSLRGGALSVPSSVAVALGVVTALSFTYSVYATSRDSSFAYFVTPARAWEFAVGGLLALTALPLGLTARLRALLSWAGLVLIVASALSYTAATPFPGAAALVPCLGTLLVIAVGSPVSRLSTARVVGLRPVQLVGDLSYSIYLVHWPLIVVLPYALGNPLTTVTKLLVLPGSLALALLSKTFVEDRFRRPGPSGRPGRVFVPALVSMLVVSAAGGGLFLPAHVLAARAQTNLQRVSAQAGPCFGAETLANPTRCPAQSDIRTAAVVPAPVIAEDDEPPRDCQSDTAAVVICTVGVTNDPARSVALVGDSHATQWLPALERLAQSHGWRITTYLKSGCAFSTATKIGVPASTGSCTEWNEKVLPMVVGGAYSLVFTSGVTGNSYRAQPGQTSAEAAVAGLQASWSAVRASGAQLVSLRDTPRPDRAGSRNLVECVAVHQRTEACRVRQDRAELVDYQEQAVSRVSGAQLVDLTRDFCSSGWCPAVVGGVLVYRDRNHVTQTYMRTLAPQLELRLRQLYPGGL